MHCNGHAMRFRVVCKKGKESLLTLLDFARLGLEL